MKGTWVLLFIFISVIISTLLFRNKHNKEQDGIDKLTATLSGIKPYLSPGAHIYIEKDAASTETFFWTRYVLAPVHLSTNNTLDTVFTIAKLGDQLMTDSSKKIIWENRDENYRYTLASKK